MKFFTAKKKNCYNTNLVCAIAFMVLMLISGFVMAQPGTMYINQDVSGTYSNSACTAKGNDFQFRIQENGSGTSSGTRNWQFNSDSYYNTWGATSSNTLSAFNTAIAPSTSTASANFQGGPGYNANGKLPFTIANYYYTYNIVKGSYYASQSMAVLQTSYNPVTIVSQSLDQTAYGPTNTPIVKVTTSAAPSAGEYVYVRYSTTSNFASSSLAAVTFSGVNGTSAALPAQAAGTTVYYYIFSSPISTVAAIGTNYDVLMLNLLNNSGSNYSYTVLSYCSNTSTSSTGYINSFNTTGGLTNVTNNTTGYTTGGYTDYTTLSPSVSQYIGSSVTANISLGSGTGGTGMAVYIDWNQNGVFTDAGELVYNPGYIYTTTAQSASITVPSGALTGTTRMRVVTDYNLPTPLSCRSGTQKGEAEDYSFTVVAIPVPTITSFTPTALCSGGGQTVTISGTNFIGITSVKFNGTNATSYTVVTPASITAVVPSGVTAGRITVTNASGTATSSAYTVTSAPPTITTNPSATSVSLYSTGTGTGTFTAATSASLPTYQWQYSTSSSGPWANVTTGTPLGVTYTGATSATLSAACSAITPPGSAYYYQCVITAGGCNSTTTSAQFTVNNYCSNINTGSTSYYMTNVSTSGGISNISQSGLTFPTNGYNFYSSLSPTISQYAGGTFSVAAVETGGTDYFGVWVDWNNNGSFADAGEQMYISTGYTGTLASGTLTVPSGTAVGNYRMRLVADEGDGTVAACTGSTYTDCLDYILTVVAAPAPTITSLGSSSGCSGGTLVINGTNLTGATAANVKIGGTAVSSITSNTGTVLTVVTGSGTTGTVAVTTSGGTATSVSAYTLNPSPTITGNPSATSVNAYASATATFTAATSTGSPSYQWQYATSSSGPWTNVADGTPTGITYSSTGTTASLSAISTTSAVAGSAYYYHCVITAGGCSSTTTAAQLTINNYCYPTTSSASTYINSFSTTSGITNITNTATGYTTGGYANYTAQSVSQYPNTAINWSVTMAGGTAGIAIWVDWNNNGVFTDAGENVYNSAAFQSTGITTGSFTVPSGQAAGNYRMRVLTDYNASTPVSCSFSGTRGEAEDYTFTVTASAVPTITSLGSSTGCAGSSLTINGTNLTGATAANVKIGGTAVSSITSNTGTVMVVVVGSGTTGTVSVTTAGGTGTSSSTYTVAAAPTAALSGTTPGCSSVTLTATPSSGVTYAWSSGGSTTSTSSFSTSGTYKVTVTDGNACTASATQTIVVNSPPTITTPPSTSYVSYCAGSTVTALTVVATGTTPTYQWYSNTTSSNSGGSSITGATSASYTPSNTYTTGAATYYYCIVSGASPCTPATSNVSGGITINPSPTITSNPSATSINAFSSGTASFTVSTSASSPTYQWQYATTSGGTYSNVANGTPVGISYTGNTTATLSLTSTSTAVAGSAYYYRCVVSASGCSSNSGSAQLTINNYCTPTGTSSSYYISNFTTTGGLTSNISNTTGFSTGGYGNYTGQSVNQVASGTVNFSTAFTGGTFGFSLWVDWNNNGTFDAGELMYNSGTQASGFSGSFVVPTGQAAGSYRMRILADYYLSTSIAPCTIDGSSDYGEAEDYTFTVVSPCITFSPSSPTICSGSSTVITASGGTGYTWSTSATTAAITVSPTITTTYTVTPTGSCTYPASITVTVNPVPTAVTVTPSSASICQGAIQTLTASGGSNTITVLSQNFDAGSFPAGWARSANGASEDWYNTGENTSGGNTWSSSYGGSGNNMYFYSYVISSSTTGYMETPAMDLSSYSSASLTFYIYNSSGTDKLRVYAKQGSGTYAQVGSASYGVYGSWTQITISLNSYSGAGFNAVKLKFEGTSDAGSSNIGVDNVVVTGTAINTFTWNTNITSLYTDATATTTPYTSGTAATTVYAKPNSTQTYTATSTNSYGCTASNTSVVTVNANSWTGATSTDWNTASNWCAGIVPTSTTDVLIPSGTTYSPVIGVSGANAVCQNLTISSGAVLTMQSSYSLAMSAGTTFLNNGTFTAGNGTVSLGGATTIAGSSPTLFNNLTINSGTVTLTNVPTINGNFTINGGNLNAAPIYGASSTLIYNITYTTYNEWASGSTTTGGNITAGTGIPNNVTINAAVTMTTSPRALAGSLTIGSAGTLNLSTTINADLYVGGNWTRNSGGLFNANGRAVWFQNGLTQTINSASGSETFSYLIVDKSSSNLVLSSSPATRVNVSGSVGDVLQLLNTGSLDLNGNSLNLTGNGGNIKVSGGARYIISSTSATINVTGYKAVTSASSGTLGIGSASGTNVTMQVTGTGIDFGSAISTIYSNLQINAAGYVANNAPAYYTGSNLIYSTGGYYGRNVEFGSLSGFGYPYNVIIQNGTTLDLSANSPSNLKLAGDLTVGNTSSGTLTMGTMTHKLTVGGNLFIGSTGTLTQASGSTGGGDIEVNGNWTHNSGGTYNQNNRAVFFIGGLNSTITAPSGEGFDYLIISKNSPANTVTLANNVTVYHILTLTTGIVNTGANYMIAFSNASGAVAGHSASSYINGNLRRYVTSSGIYDLPVGTASNYQLANITFASTALGSTTYLNANFNNATPIAPIPTSCIVNDRKIGNVLSTGSWTISPDVQPSGGATYTATLYMTGISSGLPASYTNAYGTTVTPSQQIALVKKDATINGGNWTGCSLNGGSTQTYGTHINTTQTVTSTTATVVRSGIPSFSDFAIGVEQNNSWALPVKLIYFTAVNESNNGLLTWATASETDNDHFDVERSLDGLTFGKIGRVEGHDNSSQVVNYDFTDPDLSSHNVNTLYYRLRQVDIDGNYHYSNIASVNIVGIQPTFHIISSYPNPFSDRFSVSFFTPSDQSVKISVYDIRGLLVSEESINAVEGMNVYSVTNAGRLTNGFYTMSITAGDQNYGIKMLKGQ